MEDWNDIVFFDSEVVDDDDDAPVGTLMGSEQPAPENADQSALDNDSQNDEPQPSPAQDEPAEPIVDEQEPEAVADDADDEHKEDEQKEQAVEEPVVEDNAPIDEQEPIANDEQEEEPVVEKAEEPVVEPVEEKADDKPVEKAPKAEPKKPVAKANPAKSSVGINIKGSSNLNDELFGTSFEIERPQKAKVVSTKKKQEKEQDLWSVAPIAQKKVVKRATAEAPIEQKKSAKRPAPQKAEVAQEKPTQKKATAKASAPTSATTKVDNKKTKAEENKKMAKEAVTPAVKEIEWIQEPTEKYAGTYVIKKTDKGNFVFKLFAYNKNCLAIGAQPYTSIAGCKGGINSIIKNAATAPIANLTLKNPENTDKLPRWEIYEDKKGEYRLRLLASNGNLVATTNDGYMQASGAKKGIESIAKASVGCGIRRDDNLW